MPIDQTCGYVPDTISNCFLYFKDHTHDKMNTAYTTLGIIKRNFKHLTVPTFVLLYTSMVRSHLDYCCSVWSPYRKADIEATEKVQKTATKKTLPALNHLSYSECLRMCHMTTLHCRRIRGDMIETYKIVTGKYDETVAPTLAKVSTYVTRCFRYDLRKYCFTNRVVNVWNSLPNRVISANVK